MVIKHNSFGSKFHSLGAATVNALSVYSDKWKKMYLDCRITSQTQSNQPCAISRISDVNNSATKMQESLRVDFLPSGCCAQVTNKRENQYLNKLRRLSSSLRTGSCWHPVEKERKGKPTTDTIQLGRENLIGRIVSESIMNVKVYDYWRYCEFSRDIVFWRN